MSTLLLQIFGAMTCTFLFGIVLGWLIWRYGAQKDDAGAEFWQGRYEQSRNELNTMQTAHESLSEKHMMLKKRLASSESAASA